MGSNIEKGLVGGTMSSVLSWLMLVVFGGAGCIMLFRPSLYINLKHVRETYNPKLLASPWFRINIRCLGFLFCLFVLMPATQALAGLTGMPYWASFSNTLFTVVTVVFFVLWFGYLFDWIAAKLRIIRPSFKERLEQLSPEQDAALQNRETSIAGFALAGVLLFTAIVSSARV